MRESFRGWRRQSGVVTLVWAVLLVAIWMRSLQTITTVVFIPDEGPRHVFSASPQGLTWLSRQGSGQYVHGVEFLNLEWHFTPVDDDQPDPNDIEGCHASWNWNHCGFQFGKSLLGSGEPGEHHLSLILGTIRIWRIPHWAAVLPVTLLSAWLLLSRPRPTTLKETSEPVSPEAP